MRKTVWLSAFLYSAYLCAASPDQLQIQITNHGNSDCTLTQYTILFGHVSDHTEIPKVIHPQDTQSFMMRSGPDFKNTYSVKSLLLSYSCGPQQHITLFTDSGYPRGTMKAQVLEKEIISAKSTKFPPHAFKSAAGQIHWILDY